MAADNRASAFKSRRHTEAKNRREFRRSVREVFDVEHARRRNELLSEDALVKLERFETFKAGEEDNRRLMSALAKDPAYRFRRHY